MKQAPDLQQMQLAFQAIHLDFASLLLGHASDGTPY